MNYRGSFTKFKTESDTGTLFSQISHYKSQSQANVTCKLACQQQTFHCRAILVGMLTEKGYFIATNESSCISICP